MRAFLLFFTVVLAACQTAAPENLPPLSDHVMRGLQAYSQQDGAAEFYVSVDGQRYGYSYCPHGTQSFDCAWQPRLARELCERNSNGVPCVLLTRDGRMPENLPRASSDKTDMPARTETTK